MRRVLRLVDFQQLDVENQGGVWRDQTWEASRTVGVRTRDGQSGLLANGEFWNTRVPALDDLADTDVALEGGASVDRRVELLAVFQGAGVVDSDEVTGLWESLAVAWGQSVDLDVTFDSLGHCGSVDA